MHQENLSGPGDPAAAAHPGPERPVHNRLSTDAQGRVLRSVHKAAALRGPPCPHGRPRMSTRHQQPAPQARRDRSETPCVPRESTRRTSDGNLLEKLLVNPLRASLKPG
jgi:hypothetical protein